MPHYAFEHKQKDDFHDAQDNGIPMRVIEAKNEAQATAFFVEQTTVVRKATPADFMLLARQGNEIEKA